MHSLLKECFLLNVSEMLSIQNNGFIWNLIKLLVRAWYKLFITYTLLGVRFHCTLWSKIKFLEDLRPPERRAYYGMNIVLSEMPSASPARVSHCTQRGQNISLTYFVIACKILNYPNVLTPSNDIFIEGAFSGYQNCCKYERKGNY